MKEIDCSNGGPCSDTFLGFASAETLLTEYMKSGSTLFLLLPVLVGAFVAESGLHRLAWTQSISPARWLASKLAVAATLAVAGTLALMGIFRLGASGLLGQSDLRWPDRGVYEALGPALVAYVLLAVAAGALVGLLVRRTLLAMSLTGVVTGTVLLVLGSVRWNLVPSLTVTGPRTSEPFGGLHVPLNSLMTDLGEQNAAGERFDLHRCVPNRDYTAFCPTDLKATTWYVDFHPYSHFWYVQLIETGIVLALTAAAAYAAFRVLRRSAA
jgi:hypothetical protein